jgi:putative membrane protein
MKPNKDIEKKFKILIIALSVIIPLAVAFLFTVKLEGLDFGFLPHIYAPINGLTAIVLVLAILAVKKGNVQRHQKLIKFAMLLSVLFLALYVMYHMTSDPTYYGDVDGNGKVDSEEALKFQSSRMVYFYMLISHVILSVSVIPLVLFSYLRGILGKVEEHKKLVKYTFPIWLYVAISGVVVYLMIFPFYT